MGLFGHKGPSSSTSTTTSTTWNAKEIENFMSGWNPSIYYENESMAAVPAIMQEIVNYETSSSPFDRAKQLGEYGKRAGEIAYGDYQKLHSLTGDDLMGMLTKYSGELFNSASDFMAKQDSAIEDKVNAQMGQEFANNAEMQHGNNSGAVGSSAMNNSAMGILSGGAQSMETQESQIAQEVMTGAVSMASSGIRGAIKGFSREIGAEAGLSGQLYKASAKAGNTALTNAWNAGATEWAMAQEMNNMQRHNDMINGNMNTIDEMMWLDGMLQAAGVDTTSTTTTKYHY